LIHKYKLNHFICYLVIDGKGKFPAEVTKSVHCGRNSYRKDIRMLCTPPPAEKQWQPPLWTVSSDVVGSHGRGSSSRSIFDQPVGVIVVTETANSIFMPAKIVADVYFRCVTQPW